MCAICLETTFFKGNPPMSTPKLISRYILRQFLMSFFAVMLTLGFIILLFDVIEMMKKVGVRFKKTPEAIHESFFKFLERMDNSNKNLL